MFKGRHKHTWKSSPGVKYFSSCAFHKSFFSVSWKYTDVQGLGKHILSCPCHSYLALEPRARYKAVQQKALIHWNSVKALLAHAATSSSCCVLRMEWQSRKCLIKDFSTSYLGKWVTPHCCGSCSPPVPPAVQMCTEEGSVIVICRALKDYRANFSFAREWEVLPTKTNLS